MGSGDRSVEAEKFGGALPYNNLSLRGAKRQSNLIIRLLRLSEEHGRPRNDILFQIRILPSFDFIILNNYILLLGALKKCAWHVQKRRNFLIEKLGRSQVVRQRPLEPPLVGSNPAAPALS